VYMRYKTKTGYERGVGRNFETLTNLSFVLVSLDVSFPDALLFT